jgi:hypothetical protein
MNVTNGKLKHGVHKRQCLLDLSHERLRYPFTTQSLLSFALDCDAWITFTVSPSSKPRPKPHTKVNYLFSPTIDQFFTVSLTKSSLIDFDPANDGCLRALVTYTILTWTPLTRLARRPGTITIHKFSQTAVT